MWGGSSLRGEHAHLDLDLLLGVLVDGERLAARGERLVEQLSRLGQLAQLDPRARVVVVRLELQAVLLGGGEGARVSGAARREKGGDEVGRELGGRLVGGR